MKKWLYALLVFLALGFIIYNNSQRVTTTTSIQPSTNEKRALHLFAMSDYFPEEILKDFETKNNCEVKYDNFSNNEELLAKLQAGASGYDVIVPSDYMVKALISEDLLQKIDRTKLSNLGNISKDFLNAPFDSSGEFTVPYTWGTTGLVYNSKFIKGEFDSWAVLFDKKYSGHIALLDDEREVLGAMLHKLGYSTNTTRKEELDEAQELLIRLKPYVRLFASDPKQHVLSGDVWIAHIYSGDAFQVMKTNPDLKYIVPKEGSTIWIDNLAIPSTAQNADLAHAFIDHILSANSAKVITEELLYSSPNMTVENSVETANLKPSYLKSLNVKNLEFLKDLGRESELWDRLWTEAKAH